MTAKDPEPVIMQRENERSRIAVEGWLIEGGERCKFLAIHECTGDWAVFPHGAGKLGVRLSRAAAVKVAREILAVEMGASRR
ncbi:MAG TPA: hypothetical protein VFQ77_09090 [Pseudonocardiaceae bacterium]|jgi:hypothetical protein|nr:hypothetical protein [Pseudonocardiaceae bacterium]